MHLHWLSTISLLPLIHLRVGQTPSDVVDGTVEPEFVESTLVSLAEPDDCPDDWEFVVEAESLPEELADPEVWPEAAETLLAVDP